MAALFALGRKIVGVVRVGPHVMPYALGNHYTCGLEPCDLVWIVGE